MSFPGLYSIMKSCTYPKKTTTTAPTDAVLTHLLNLLMCLLLFLLTYCTYYYAYGCALRTAIRTYYPADIRAYMHWKKKKLVHLHSLRRHCTYWCTYSMYLLLMHARTSKKKNYLRWTYVPTVRTALTNAISTHLLHKSTVPTVRTYYCCTYSYWWMYSSTAVRTSCTHFKYLTITYVHEARKAETYEEKNCQGTWWDVNTQARAKPR